MNNVGVTLNVLLISTKSSASGALTILNEIVREFNNDKNINLKIIISSGTKIDNRLKFEVFEYTNKKSLMLNFIFRYLFILKIIKTNNLDYILSLENYIPIKFRVRTGLLVHNSLPFLNHYKQLGIKMYTKTRIQKLYYFLFRNNPNEIFVQLDWFRNTLVKYIRKDNVYTVKTFFGSDIGSFQPNTSKVFFYPSTEFIYKNHLTIIEALTDQLISEDFVIIFTVSQDFVDNLLTNFENSNVLSKKIIASGYLNREEVLTMMKTSTIIFPSKIECFPTPLAEAIKIGAPILAVNEPYAVEFLEGYDNYILFSDSSSLSECMKDIIKKQIFNCSSVFKSNASYYPSLVETIRNNLN